MDFETSKAKAIKYIGISKKTEQEVRNKLFSLKLDEEMIDKVIFYLIDNCYIDDLNYVDAYIRQNMRLFKFSIYELKQKLLQKGIKKDIIEEKFNVLYESDYESQVIKKMYDSKFKNMDDIKIKKYLYSKGFRNNDWE